jgi:hypothetical protein
MARASLTKTTALGAYGTYSAAAAKLTMAAANVADMNQFTFGGEDLIVAHNTGGSPYTLTISSVADPYGRTQDITTYSIPAGEYAVFGPFKAPGWLQSDGKIYLAASNASVLLGVVKLPG